MEAIEHPVTESRSERIARYKAERRRELAERYGNVVELPTKWVRRDGKEVEDPAQSQAQRGTVSSGEGVNGRKREVVNGDVDAPADPNRGQGSQDSACMLIGEEHDAPQLHTGVSVGRLRSALLQQTTSGVQPDKVCPDAGRATSSLDLAVQPGSEGGRRRTRRYLPGGPGGGRKTSERFRTQPITANEVEESSGLLDAEEEENHKADVKTDARAKMSVAAKMSLFKELEKSAEPQALKKPLPGNVCHERKVRRGNDHRFMTQPITCEEMVAISAPKAVPPVESQCVQAESADDVDESCKLSMSEKLALFNKLSLPGQKGPADGPPERRRLKGARYRTQPITVEEVNLLQKGPVQLPAFSLSPHLSDRQQASSVNLKPSEVRLSQPRPDPGPVPGEVDGPTQQVQQRRDSEPGLRGILKKSCSGVSELIGMGDSQKDSPSSHEQNGRSCEDTVTQKKVERMEQQDFSVPPRRERRPPSGSEGGSLTAAPWRQRTRARRETIACTPVRASSEQEEGNSWSKVQEHLLPSVEHNGTVQRQQNLDESVRKTNQESSLTGHVHVSVIDNTVLPQEENSSSRNQEETLCVDRVDPQRWEPVFASVYSSSTPQYVMCFNQTNLSFEAQEVPSPTGNLVQPQRQKTKAINNELCTDEADGTDNRGLESLASHGNDASRDSTEAPTHTHEASHSPPLSVAPQEVKQETPVDDAGDRSPSSACVPPQPLLPYGGVPAIETQQDLGVLCQTNAPMLTSAVAVHRRSVRPSRRTQGSRNPLRALAARDDITQDYMGDRVNLASEERIQTEKKCKNSSGSHPTRSEGVISSLDAATSGSYPPFSSLMLLHIKGRRQVQVRLVEPSVRSLNSGDCFLLVTPDHCIVWRGEFANEQERQKASELASAIQSRRDLGCQASEIILLEEGVNCDGSMATDFWRLLGGRTQYRGASEEEEDELYERGVVESNCVYRLLENRLVPVEQAWASSPSVSLLGFSEVLVFDFGSEVYLWHRQDVSPSRRSVALQLIHQLWAGAYDYSNCRVNPLDPTQCNPSMPLRGEGRPTWALLGCVSEHEETILFKEKFLDWSSRTGGGEDGSPAQSAPVQSSQSASSSSHLPNACDAKVLASGHFLEGDGLVHNVLAGVDIGRGHGAVTLDDGRRMELQTCSVKMWHVQEFDDWEIPTESSGQLHEGDSYLIRWTYRLNAVEKVNSPEDGSREPNKTTALFLWRGRHCSVSRKDTAAFVSIGMTGHDESQVVVPQGNEPPCFLQLFHGGLVIHKSKRDKVPNAAEWRLFCVRGELPEEGSLLEVEPCCASLRSRGSVVLLNSQEGVLFLWVGCKAHTSSREVGRRAVECLTQNRPPELGLSQSKLVEVQEVEEGTEPAEFWTALGHMDRKAYDCMLQDPGKFNFTPRLFHLSSASGTSQAEELQSPTRLPGVVMSMPFVQECLYSVPQPALFLLDNHLEVYLWQSGRAERADPSWLDDRRRAVQTTLQYCKEINPRRPPQAYLICEGSEPLTFTNTFPRWERSLGALTQGDVGQVKLTLVQDALAQLMKTQYPLEELLQSPLPEGVDPQHLEVYLSDEDFQTILEMKRDEYASLPSWKQIELKRRKGLLC